MINWTIQNKNGLLEDHSSFDTILFDPPYDAGLYSSIPRKESKNKNLIVWCSSPFIDKVFKCASQKGWNYSFMIVWDTQSCWYVPNRVLQRDNICVVFSENKYNEDNAIVTDGIYRKSVTTRNTRGNYTSKEKKYSKLTSVFSLMRSGMNKSHPHEKPTELMAGILGAVSAKRCIDLFAGSGAFALSAQIAECTQYLGFEIDKQFSINANNNVSKKIDGVKTIKEFKEWANPKQFELF